MRFFKVLTTAFCVLGAENSGFYGALGVQYSSVTQSYGTNAQTNSTIQFSQTTDRVPANSIFSTKGKQPQNPPRSNTINAVTEAENQLTTLQAWDGKTPAPQTDNIQAAISADHQALQTWANGIASAANTTNQNNTTKVLGGLFQMLTEQVETNFKPKQTQVVEPIKSELTTFYDKTFDPLYQAFSSDTPISINGINTQLQNMSNALANLGESSLQQLLKVDNQGNLEVQAPNRAGLTQVIKDDVIQAQAITAALQKGIQECEQSSACKALFINSIYSSHNRVAYDPKINRTTTHASFGGVNLQVGYKYFFGSKRRWGVRAYGNFGYNGGKIKTHAINNVVYGVGVDGLYNFLERGAYTQGVFLGLILAGSTWNGGDSLIACAQSNACKISAKTTYFQLPLNMGYRSNFGKNGFEVGLRVPLLPITHKMIAQESAQGTFKQEFGFRRDVSVYANYVYNF
ncbi:outer membrane protein [Helicobacter felis]|uniref:OMP1200 n=1 Tax=Helicobacter felis TaxID=214 RepID=A0A1M4NGI7_HELFE|nr:outer membrane protein [Helicobacter felis]SFZ71320.1 OMP1200 [Helicobacter felis]